MVSDKIKRVVKWLKRQQNNYKKPDLFINLTYQCPMRCKFCYVNYTRDKDFTQEDLDYLFEEGILNTNNVKLVSFFGGEPLVRIDLLEHIVEKFYTKLSLKGIHMGVITSMSVNTERYIKLIKKYPLLESVMSFDNNVEARILANGKPFKILEHLDLEDLRECNQNICFHTVIDSDKSIDDILLCQKIFKEYGFIYSWCWNKTPNHIFDFKEKYKKIIQNIIDDDNYYPRALTDDFYHYYNRDNIGCGLGAEIYISSNGDISPCSISHHINEFMIMKEGIINDDVYESLEDIEKNILNNDDCKKCIAKGFCNGGCRVERKRERNNYNSVNPSWCYLQKQLLETYDEWFESANKYEIEKVKKCIYNTHMATLGYCFDTSINLDMHQAFNIKE